MTYTEALKKAQAVLDLLAPHCYRIEIAGSIRRKKEKGIKDIEIVAIPKPYELGLFESGIATVINQWKKVRGELRYEGEDRCKWTQRITQDGTKVDIFFANEMNWGYILAIRTGPFEYSRYTLAATWVKLGYRGQEGSLTMNLKPVPVPEEKTLFELLKIPFVAPELRR